MQSASALYLQRPLRLILLGGRAAAARALAADAQVEAVRSILS